MFGATFGKAYPWALPSWDKRLDVGHITLGRLVVLCETAWSELFRRRSSTTAQGRIRGGATAGRGKWCRSIRVNNRRMSSSPRMRRVSKVIEEVVDMIGGECSGNGHSS